MKEIKTLIKTDGTSVPCVVFPNKKLVFPFGEILLVYSENQIIKGFSCDESYVSELEIIVEFAIIPELDELLKENVICIEY